MNAPKKNVQRPVWNHLLLLGRCSSIVGKSRVQRSGLGPHCTAPARWGWRLARRSRIEIALSVLKRPPSPSERLIAHSVGRSARRPAAASNGASHEQLVTRTVDTAPLLHQHQQPRDRPTDGRRATATSAEQRTCLCIPRTTAGLHATPRRQKQ